MSQGVIKKIVSDRGFGFISASRDGGKQEDVFFHHSTVEGGQFDDLQEGQAVEYEIDDDSDSRRQGKGPRASVVRLANG
ncbi:MAG: cold shock domain-containing protein [Thermoguttaceae bacterium]|jgi:CspA family cold shock protein